MSGDHATDEELMQRVSGGNREAMTPLVRRYASSLLTFIRRMTGDWHRAEELFQEAFLALWQERGRYDWSRPFRPWLFGIAARKCQAEYRRAAASSESLSDWLESSTGSREPSPVEAAVQAETATLVAAAVATLPPKQRAVLVMRVYSGMEYAEIAQAMERSQATIRSEMFHALAGLRRYLEPRMRRAGEDCHDQA
jgi:RNA polymerase sigma-70 factor (ECF subfamily)